MVRRIREAVHARHNEQYEREVEKTRDGDDDEHLVGGVAHAGRRGLQYVLRPCCGRDYRGRAVADYVMTVLVVVVVMVAVVMRGRHCARTRAVGRCARGRPSVGGRHPVMIAAVPDGAPP